MKRARVLLVSISPPEEGGSQRNVAEIGKCDEVTAILTQKGSNCEKAICLPTWNHSALTRNITFFVLCFFYSLGLLLTSRKYDIIQTEENLCYLLVPFWSLRYKTIVTVQGLRGFKFYDNKFLWFHFKLGLKFADKIIAADFVEKALLEKIGFNNVVYISNGADVEVYNGIRAKPDKTITFVGRIHRQKGIDNLFKAFNMIKHLYPEYSLKIVGKNSGEFYEKLSKEYADERIIWKGFILDRKELFSEIVSSEILVYPSRWEAMPWPALLEGLASGRAVIASGLPGLNEIFKDGKEILLVKPEDVEDLAIKIEFLINNAKARDQIGKNGKVAAQQYNWDNIREKTIAVYENNCFDI